MGPGGLAGEQEVFLTCADLTYAILTKLLLFLVCYVVAFWGPTGCHRQNATHQNALNFLGV